MARNYRISDDYRPKFGRTVIRGDLWKGFFQDMGNITKEGGVNFNNGKKPFAAVDAAGVIGWNGLGPERA
ncbi:hypothetical protein [Rhodococcus aetherivorans]|uniref:hypothetical protein n=1 Tax=Rhodococcus aetherivorans TaxID=191292 RepID=UPI0021E4E5CF|nr:hypothetical protein [Rhodococcus aetherivorans]MDV6296458.1 hypothetical protein [Rhodococcus aetherivorans]